MKDAAYRLVALVDAYHQDWLGRYPLDLTLKAATDAYFEHLENNENSTAAAARYLIVLTEGAKLNCGVTADQLLTTLDVVFIRRFLAKNWLKS